MKPTVKKPERCGPCIHFSIVTLIVGPRIRTMFESCPAGGQWFSAIAPLPGIARIRSVADCGRASTGARRGMLRMARNAANAHRGLLGGRHGRRLERGRQLEHRRCSHLGQPRFDRRQRSNGHDPAGRNRVGRQPVDRGRCHAVACPAEAIHQPDENWIVNPGFESPIASNNTTSPSTWWHWGSTVLSGQYAYTGSQSLVVSGAELRGHRDSRPPPALVHGVGLRDDRRAIRSPATRRPT